MALRTALTEMFGMDGGRGDLDYLPIWAGEPVDMITAAESAAELVGIVARCRTGHRHRRRSP
jgi:hypothetical protein